MTIPDGQAKIGPRYESHRNSYKEFEPKTADHDGGKSAVLSGSSHCGSCAFLGRDWADGLYGGRYSAGCLPAAGQAAEPPIYWVCPWGHLDLCCLRLLGPI